MRDDFKKSLNVINEITLAHIVVFRKPAHSIVSIDFPMALFALAQNWFDMILMQFAFPKWMISPYQKRIERTKSNFEMDLYW